MLESSMMKHRWTRDMELDVFKAGEDAEERKSMENVAFHFLDRFVMPEGNMLRKVWECLLLVMLLYIGIVFPYKLAFEHFRLREDVDEPCTDFKEAMLGIVWEQVVQWFFLIDLFINFFLSYPSKDGRGEVCSFKAIARNYLQSMFLLNLIACLPPEAFEPLVAALPLDPGGCSEGLDMGDPHQASRLVRMQRATRLARLARLLRIGKLQRVLKSVATALDMLRAYRMLNQITFLAWVSHFMACGWYLCAAMHTDHVSTWVGRRGLLQESSAVQWVHSMYFILTVFTTVGFGDMSAYTVGEIVYVILVMLIGTVVNSIVIAEVINLVQEVDHDTAWKKRHISLLEAYGSHTALPEETLGALTEFVSQLYTSGSYDRDGMSKFFTSVVVPRHLLGDMPKHLFKGLLVKNKFVTTCARSIIGGQLPPRFPLLLSTKLNAQIFREEDIVYQMHDHAFNVYFVMDGLFCYVREAVEPSDRRSLGDIAGADGGRRPSLVEVCKKISVASINSLSSRSRQSLPARTITLHPRESDRSYSSSRDATTASQLGQYLGAWSPRDHEHDKEPWLQLDLGCVKKVKGVVMQGHPKRDEWVKKYRLAFAFYEEGPWREVEGTCAGCADRSTEKQTMLDAEVPARFVRVVPVEWHSRISLRVGVCVMAPKLYSYRVFNRLDFFGDELLLGETRYATARCDDDGQVLMLHKRDLLPDSGSGLLAEFPEFKRPLRAESVKRNARRARMVRWFGEVPERCRHATSAHDCAAYIVQVAWRAYREKPAVAQGDEAELQCRSSSAKVKLEARLRKRAEVEDFNSRVISLIEGLSEQVAEVKTTLAQMSADGRHDR